MVISLNFYHSLLQFVFLGFSSNLGFCCFLVEDVFVLGICAFFMLASVLEVDDYAF